jgi:hypothetical protein
MTIGAVLGSRSWIDFDVTHTATSDRLKTRRCDEERTMHVYWFWETIDERTARGRFMYCDQVLVICSINACKQDDKPCICMLAYYTREQSVAVCARRLCQINNYYYYVLLPCVHHTEAASIRCTTRSNGIRRENLEMCSHPPLAPGPSCCNLQGMQGRCMHMHAC